MSEENGNNDPAQRNSYSTDSDSDYEGTGFMAVRQQLIRDMKRCYGNGRVQNIPLPPGPQPTASSQPLSLGPDYCPSLSRAFNGLHQPAVHSYNGYPIYPPQNQSNAMRQTDADQQGLEWADNEGFRRTTKLEPAWMRMKINLEKQLSLRNSLNNCPMANYDCQTPNAFSRATGNPNNNNDMENINQRNYYNIAYDEINNDNNNFAENNNGNAAFVDNNSNITYVANNFDNPVPNSCDNNSNYSPPIWHIPAPVTPNVPNTAVPSSSTASASYYNPVSHHATPASTPPQASTSPASEPVEVVSLQSGPSAAQADTETPRSLTPELQINENADTPDQNNENEVTSSPVTPRTSNPRNPRLTASLVITSRGRSSRVPANRVSIQRLPSNRHSTSRITSTSNQNRGSASSSPSSRHTISRATSTTNRHGSGDNNHSQAGNSAANGNASSSTNSHPSTSGTSRHSTTSHASTSKSAHRSNARRNQTPVPMEIDVQPIRGEASVKAEVVSEAGTPPTAVPNKRARMGHREGDAEQIEAEIDLSEETTPEEVATEEATDSNNTPKVYKIKQSHLNQSLLSLLECPVCLECMEPPMAQCRRGHLICSACRDRMMRCPVCRASFTSVRNRAMEQVAEKLFYPCRHGCARLIMLRGRPDHENSCARRLYTCPFPACAGKTLPYSDLINHFLDTHPDSVAFGSKGTFRYSRAVNQHDWIMSAHGQIFHVQFQTNRTYGVYGSVTYIGPKNESDKYEYEITIVGNEKSRKLVYSRETHSDLDCKSKFYTQGDSFFIGFENALTFGNQNNSNNLLVFKVQVKPVDEIAEQEESA